MSKPITIQSRFHDVIGRGAFPLHTRPEKDSSPVATRRIVSKRFTDIDIIITPVIVLALLSSSATAGLRGTWLVLDADETVRAAAAEHRVDRPTQLRYQSQSPIERPRAASSSVANDAVHREKADHKSHQLQALAHPHAHPHPHPHAQAEHGRDEHL